jgi:hypothetical protein
MRPKTEEARVKVRMETVGRVEILRYEGSHSCRDEDHSLDSQVHEHLARSLAEGRRHYLFDLRKALRLLASGDASE